MKSLKTDLLKYIKGGTGHAGSPKLPERSQASAQVGCELIDTPAKH
ncbi:hypothetical protein J8M20_11285 [Pseudoalteromonas luteoviolacea]|nr:hypothetical protein [Pseudoalteromonas luteoviolacea]MBQ4811926.1 hypothetical protein [Pseudoalteromonas luteoviolacea]